MVNQLYQIEKRLSWKNRGKIYIYNQLQNISNGSIALLFNSFTFLVKPKGKQPLDLSDKGQKPRQSIVSNAKSPWKPGFPQSAAVQATTLL